MAIVKIEDFLKEFSLEDLITTENRANLKFTGYNPSAIMNKLIKAGLETSDLGTMCYLFLTRGNNVKDMMTKTNGEGKAVIETLVEKYDLVSKVKGSGSDAVNLARVAGLSPSACYLILTNTDAADFRPVPHSDLKKIHPKWMCFLGFASILPPSGKYISPEDEAYVKGSLLIYAIQESKILDVNNQRTFKEASALVKRFFNAAFSSNHFKFDDRVKFTKTHFKEIVQHKVGGFQATALAIDLADKLAKQTELDEYFF